MAYDSARGVTVLYGGKETWEWNGASWTKRDVPNPPVRTSHAMAYDSARGKTVLFGGHDGSLIYGDTWEWDGNAWTERFPAHRPPARFTHNLAYDQARSVVVLTGTLAQGNERSDTWEWNGDDWGNEKAFVKRMYGAIAYDVPRARTIVFGGTGQTTLELYSDTREWDGKEWVRTTSSGPPYVDGAAMMFHAAAREAVLFGGFDTYNTRTFHDHTWTYRSRGGACTTGTTCDTGNCVDGVCCESASCGKCEACNRSNAGICQRIFAVPNPEAGVNSEQDPDTCAGTRACNVNGTCVKLNGQSCTNGTECLSTYCVDGVCCNGPCNGLCQACSPELKASGAADGVCDHAKSGTDSRNQCATASPTTCQQDGVCDGNGGCRRYAAGTNCGGGACGADNEASGNLCDGSGVCRASSAVDCTPGLCKVGGCVEDCSTNDDCATSGFCDGGHCALRRALGAVCKKGEECSSNLCVDGVCCNAPCSGQCEACDVPGAGGVCVPVTGKVHGSRTACAGPTNDNPCSAASCDGKTRDTCLGQAGSEVTCRDRRCVTGVETLVATCDGHGSCPAALTKPCEPYGCGEVGCKTECTSDGDCDEAYHCEPATKRCVKSATCDDHVVKTLEGTTIDCSPFRCESNGTCKTKCASTGDCIEGTLCDPRSGACVRAGSDEAACAIHAARVGSGDLAGWLMVFGALARRRRMRTNNR
jgi:hypothetical protein